MEEIPEENEMEESRRYPEYDSMDANELQDAYSNLLDDRFELFKDSYADVPDDIPERVSLLKAWMLLKV